MTETVEIEVASVDYSRVTFEEELDDGMLMREEEPVIHCTGYTEDGEYHHVQIRGFEPYFYVPYDDIQDKPHVKRYEVYDDGDPIESVRGERLARAVVRDPGQVSDIREDFDEHWESDVRFPQRFITDLGLTSGLRFPAEQEYVDVDEIETCDVDADWRVHYMDIEVDDRNGFPQNGEEEILCVTAYDSFEDEYVVWIQGGGSSTMEDLLGEDDDRLHDSPVNVRWYEDEVTMLQMYFAYLRGTKPSIITGWNSDGFDLPYLEDRCEVLAEEHDADLDFESISLLWSAYCNDWGPSIKGTVALDLMDAYEANQITEPDSLRLEAVAQDELGVGKETFVGKVGKLWEDDPAALVDYNLRDVELLVELDRRQSLIDFAREIKRFAACQLDDAIIEATVADRYLLNLCNGNVVLPPQHSREGEDFEGATVFEAANGLHEWVATLDLASLYPMSMLTLNASPETKVDPDEFEGPTRVSPNGIHFRTDQDAITREVIENLLEERTEKKRLRNEHDPESEAFEVYDLQQYAIKVIMNSLYGVMAWTKFRLYDVDVASAVTATGRSVIERTGEVVDELGYPVLYGDTDSVLLDVSELAEGADDPKDVLVDACTRIEAQVNDAYDEFAEDIIGTEEHHFDIEFEKLYRRYFQAGKKKRYAGHVVWDEGKDVDKVGITGFDYVRSDTSEFTKRVQHEVVERIVTGEPLDEIVEYVRKERKKFDERRVSLGEIGLPSGMNKELHEYNSDSAASHTPRATKTGNLIAGMTHGSGAKPRKYYLDGVNPARFAELEDDGLDPNRDAMYREFKRDPDVLGVERPEQLPPEVRLDWDEMKRKNLKLPIQDILGSLGVSWDTIESESHQSGLEAFG